MLKCMNVCDDYVTTYKSHNYYLHLCTYVNVLNKYTCDNDYRI